MQLHRRSESMGANGYLGREFTAIFSTREEFRCLF